MKTEVLTIHPEFPELERLARCAKVIRQGGLVVFPTETVYGIAADFNNPKAIERLRQVKQRAEDKPFSIHVSQKGLISNYSRTTDPKVYKLIDRYWPGPLTVIVPAQEEDQTIGIRMPDNRIAISLLEISQCTVAAPSANLKGQPPPSTCKEALRDLDGLVDIAIDGGKAAYGKASSVVDFTQEQPKVLREGAISQQDVDQVTGKKTILFVCTGNSCRSVMAEFLLRDRVKARDDVEVLSAGTCVFIRSTASSDTLSVLRKEGINASRHQSQGLSSTLLHKADLVLAMTKGHRQQILERLPSVEQRVYLLREFTSERAGSGTDMDILDPMGKPAQAYADCIVMIKDAVDKLVKLI